jgi:hypothetical protein
MTLKEFADLGSGVGGFATGLGLVGVVVAAYFAKQQIDIAKQQIVDAHTSQLEVTAKEAYGNYLQLATEHVDLADGGVAEDDANFPKYQWFVSYFLNACEQILDTKKDDEGWIKCIETEIAYHKNYICKDSSFRFSELTLYSDELRAIIKRVADRLERES